ncbi:phage virion morphogenesis protein [Dickeya dadantii]|uniref:phage virion morphogenesis protein n=1 Tax=Dickeya dadantii TaxID=204038 RepID=UPI0014959A5A|nr:phage virion morphogenesis protein [Dickeya dadantii]NPE59277.1 phage virion morphogenesis protein [Dickeya dadantii]NPE70334.1 phage virion morphogenesis protein [Dickeya dadantii]
MSTVSVTINDRELRRGLRALEMAATDMTPAMRKIAGTLQTETALNFGDEGRPKWLVSLAAEDRSGQTLRETGRLAASVSTDYDSSHATIGTNVIYAAIHQFGGKTGRNESVELPARPYLPVDADGELQPETVRSVLDMIQRHLESAAHG